MEEQIVWECIKSEDWAILTPEQIAGAKAQAKDLHNDPAFKHIPLRQLESEFIQHAQAKTSYEAGKRKIIDYFIMCTRQLESKYPNPSTDTQGWLGNIWDMIHCASKGDIGESSKDWQSFLKETWRLLRE